MACIHSGGRETAPRNATQAPMGTPTTASKTLLPSLARLVQKVVTESMFQAFLETESEFARKLQEVRSKAQERIENIIEIEQKELEDSQQVERVKDLCRQLKQAELALLDHQERTRKSCQEKVDEIQDQHVHDRSEMTAEYVKERHELIQQQSEQILLGGGTAVCMTCSSAFTHNIVKFKSLVGKDVQFPMSLWPSLLQ